MIEIVRPTLHAAQRVIASSSARFKVVACGRRWGKTTLAIHQMINAAIRSQRIAYTVPTYKMLREVWEALSTRLGAFVTASSRTEGRMALLGGGVIEFWSLDKSYTLRGRAYDLLVIDEAASVRDLAYIWQRVLRPTLTDREGHALFCSTPRGRGFFYELYQRGGNTDNPDWAAWQQPSSSNPRLPVADLAQARRELPEAAWLQEYEAHFLENGAGVFRRVREAATAVPSEPIAGRTYVIGCDWGKQHDYTVLIVLDAATGAMVAMERLNQIDYAVQANTLRGLAARYQPTAIIAERNSIGEPIIEALQRHGLPVRAFTTTNASKANAIEALQLAFEQGDIRIFNDPVLLNELHAFGMERLPSGMVRYTAPSGQHDDCVMALALAWHGCSNRVGTLAAYV